MAALLASLLQISITIGLIGQAVAYYVPPPEPIDNTVYIHWLKEPIPYEEVVRVADSLEHSRSIESDEIIKIRRIIVREAIEQGVGIEMALYIAEKESGFIATAVGDLHLTCKKTGLPIRSRGIWQINDCANPDVPDWVAFDPLLSTQWAMPRLLKKPEIWTVYDWWLEGIE